jgi:Tol biopolymer transport system component/C-terminal processing protease CtpA/Prc
MKRLIIILLILFWGEYIFGQSSPSWLRYPSLSPDGKTIVFTYKSDLYTVAATGGTAVQLTSSKAEEWMPVWSHNGRSIAFASDRYGNADVFLVSANGRNEKQLTFHAADEYPYDFNEEDQQVVFGGVRMDAVDNRQFPSDAQPELYRVSVNGGRVTQLLTVPAEDAKVSRQYIIYHDKKNRENGWRKHQVSAAARDIWLYDRENGTYKQLTDFAGEDRSPVFTNKGKAICYLSEESGSFNVHRLWLDHPGTSEQLTSFKHYPVRFLSAANNGTLCFGFNGDIYLQTPGAAPKKVSIRLTSRSTEDTNVVPVADHIKYGVVSPSGKEFAFIFRGDVFSADMERGVLRQMTHTPGEEADLSFSPDGTRLLYASENNAGWRLCEMDQLHGKESVLLANGQENYQPLYSPDGKEVAYIENRVTLKIYNIASGKSRRIASLFSRKDHDQYFRWSPDAQYLLLQYNPPGAGNQEVGLVAADGTRSVHNITQSGFGDEAPQWAMNGKMMIWKSDRNGLRGFSTSSGRQQDVYALPFAGGSFKDAERITKLTPAAAMLGDVLLSKSGNKLYYLVKAGTAYQLWITDIPAKTSTMPLSVKAEDCSLQWDAAQQQLFLLADARILQLDTTGQTQHSITINGAMKIDLPEERKAMFSHIRRRTKEAFYTAGYHGADWEAYGRNYEKFLPHIANNFELAELVSEMLGELNVSHSGATGSNIPGEKEKEETASLGICYDVSYSGAGVKISEILATGPLDQEAFGLKPGMFIMAVDGEPVTADKDLSQYLNHRAGKNTRLSINDGSQLRDIVVTPVTLEAESDLLYKRWVKRNRDEVTRLSNGQLGYVHLYRMNDAAYRHAYSEIMGRYAGCKGIIVDTRFNRGGDLASDLGMMLSGTEVRKNTTDFQVESIEPGFRWTKPSVVIANEANYSDGSCFVFDYQYLHMGKLIGMPVPGSCTFMTGETLPDGNLHWSVPSLGVKSREGYYLENNQTEPDIRVNNAPEEIIKGRDQQLEAAIRQLMKETAPSTL